MLQVCTPSQGAVLRPQNDGELALQLFEALNGEGHENLLQSRPPWTTSLCYMQGGTLALKAVERCSSARSATSKTTLPPSA